MEILYPLIIAFTLVFISELGDKTQILVLSFSSRVKTFVILAGVALGSFFSHGLAILFGSFLGNIDNDLFHTVLEIITYLSFIFFGIVTLLPSKENSESNPSLSNKLSKLKFNYVLIIAFSIAIGELGDKTFLASIGLGIEYYSHKIMLIIGAILGMIASDSIAIFLGKFLSKALPEKLIEKISGALFLIFGFVRFCKFSFLKC